MGKKFNISARAARLIWRENISNAEWALIELVKNSYDADAELCYIYLYVPISKKIDTSLNVENFEILKKEWEKNDINYKKFYTYDKNTELYFLSEINKISLEEEIKLKSFLYIIDNWEWMSESIIDTSWMTIATDNKESSKISKNWRVRTWAKWMWRFALDRLWETWEMYTFNGKWNLLYWKINWENFEDKWKILSDVEAEFKYCENDYEQKILDIKWEFKSNIIDNYTFKTWTMLKVSKLRDIWDISQLLKLKNWLINLLPPSWIEKFDICLLTNFLEEKK